MRWMPKTIVRAVIVSLGVWSISPARADEAFFFQDDKTDLVVQQTDSADPAEAVASPASEIQELRQRLDLLEASEEARLAKERSKAEDEKKKSAAAKSDGKPLDNVWTDVSADKWTVRLGGHVQADYINWPYADPAITGPAANPPARDYFEFRRLRLMAEGTGYGVYDFRLQMTLEPETTNAANGDTLIEPQVKDAYFSINEVPWLGRLRIGNFFVPFGLEQVTNDTFNVFLERSIPTQGVFTADREVGVAAYNVSADESFTWTYGMFFDSISESIKQRVDSNQGYRLSGRVTWLPYYDELSNGRYLIHTGAGILHTHDQDGIARFAARPQVRLSPRLIDSGNLAAGDYTTANLELALVMGPVTIQSEAFACRVNLNNDDPAHLLGAYAHLSWFLTGENRVYERFGQHGAQFGRNVPFSNVFATASGVSLGAWEAKARWSYLDLNAVDRGQYNDMTLGMNWYWSDRTRVMFDYIHPMTTQDTTFGSTESDILGMRFDFNW